MVKAFSCYLFTSTSPDVSALQDIRWQHNSTEFMLHWYQERDRHAKRGRIFFLLMLPVCILSCIVEIDSGPQDVGMEGDESQQESSTSSREGCYARDSQSGVGNHRHHNHQPSLFSLIFVPLSDTRQALYTPTSYNNCLLGTKGNDTISIWSQGYLGYYISSTLWAVKPILPS